jgi:hypothetical protein
MQPCVPEPAQALQQADATLQPLMQSVRAAVFASPLDVPAAKTSLIALFEYLSSPAGRTDTNCCAVDGFFCLAEDLPLERLPDSLQDVFAPWMRFMIRSPHPRSQRILAPRRSSYWSVCVTQASNQAMERTADRCAPHF